MDFTIYSQLRRVATKFINMVHIEMFSRYDLIYISIFFFDWKSRLIFTAFVEHMVIIRYGDNIFKYCLVMQEGRCECYLKYIEGTYLAIY